jgi:uncharacterized protein (TIGR03435 family)
MKLRLSLLAGFLCSALASGQKPEFEVASVKANNSGQTAASGGFSLASGRLNLINWRMKALIMMAYKVRMDYIEGPSWLNTDRFDIVANAHPNTSDADARLMLSALLVDRFKLTIHEEQRAMPVFVLVVGKSGAHLIPPAGSGELTCHPGKRDGVEGQSHIECANVSLQDLADLLPDLSRDFDRPVVDATGVGGVYDFRLDWTPQPAPPKPGENSADIAAGVTIFENLEKQYGLKLEQRKQPMPVIIVDHAERVPTEN